MLSNERMDDLDLFVARCRRSLTDADPPQAVLAAATSHDHFRLAKAVEERPQPWFFTTGEDLTVFATAGQPGTGSAPHDHGLWAVIACLAGREGSRCYRLVDETLTEDRRSMLDAGEAHLLPSEAIHAVFNCWTAPNLVLHVYGGDFLGAPKHVWDPITGNRAELGLNEPLVPTSVVGP